MLLYYSKSLQQFEINVLNSAFSTPTNLAPDYSLVLTLPKGPVVPIFKSVFTLSLLRMPCPLHVCLSKPNSFLHPSSNATSFMGHPQSPP